MNDNDSHSEKVNKIMMRQPGFIVRWGTLLMFLLGCIGVVLYLILK